MQTIHKYRLQIVSEQPVTMPSGAEILCVQMQGDTPCIWAMVNPDNPNVTRSIAICGTGHPVPVGNYKYVGTVQQFGGSLIWHIFQRPE
jgi:hypothetical protein